jgi:hypothetical protein
MKINIPTMKKANELVDFINLCYKGASSNVNYSSFYTNQRISYNEVEEKINSGKSDIFYFTMKDDPSEQIVATNSLDLVHKCNVFPSYTQGNTPVIYSGTLAVHPKFQNKGFGSKIFKDVIYLSQLLVLISQKGELLEDNLIYLNKLEDYFRANYDLKDYDNIKLLSKQTRSYLPLVKKVAMFRIKNIKKMESIGSLTGYHNYIDEIEISKLNHNFNLLKEFKFVLYDQGLFDNQLI